MLKELNYMRFAPSGKEGFYAQVTKRVHDYFKEQNISPYANRQMWVKTVSMLLIYFIPLVLLISGLTSGNLLIFFSMWFIMGVGMVGIGTSVMHDAQHETYSSKRRVNRSMGFILEILGGYAVTWRIQHNLLHHRFTNVYGLDEDIDNIKLLRFTPRQTLQWYHRYQHIYVWLFYMIMTLFWMTAKDYVQLLRYHKKNLLVGQKVTLKQALLRVSIFKAGYYSYILILPILFSGASWPQVILGFLLMHAVAGLSLSCIFQPAHIMETSEFAEPVKINEVEQMQDSWAVHEVANTTNFAPKNRLLSWFIGGLNFQIEHHLFTNICHVHYPKIVPIVKITTREYGITYHEEPTFVKALVAHVRMLKKLGRH